MLLKETFKPFSTCSPETAQKIRRRIMPFSELDTYRGRKDEVKTNFRGLQPLDQLLLLPFVLDTVLLVVVAIYAPQLTGSIGYSLWQFLQFAFLVYLAYRIGKHKNQAQGKS